MKNLLRRIKNYIKGNDEDKKRRVNSLKHGNYLEGYLYSRILCESEKNRAELLLDYKRLVVCLELIKTPNYENYDWSSIEFNINIIEDLYSRYIKN